MQIPVVTGMDQARNVILVRSCDAVIAVGGMFGTLSEIALALKLGIPVIGLRTWRLRQPDGRRVAHRRGALSRGRGGPCAGRRGAGRPADRRAGPHVAIVAGPSRAKLAATR